MTNQPTSWTDGYGTVHAGPPPAGYWIASDDRWYAPELHPDVVAEPADRSLAADPFADTQAFDPDLLHTEILEKETFEAETVEVGAPYVGAFDAVPSSDTTADTDAFAFDSATAVTESLPVIDIEPTDTPTETNTPTETDTGALTDTEPAMPAADEPAWELPHSWEPPKPDLAPPEPVVAPDLAEKPGTPNRTLIGVAVGAMALLGVMAAGYTLANRGDDDSTVIAGETAMTVENGSATTTVPEVERTTTVAPDPNPGAVQPVASTGDLEGIESCTRIDEQTLEISILNVTDATASYLLTVAYLDAEGTRIGDDNVYVSSLRPGERAIEQSYVFSDAGVGCEVIEADRYDRNGVEGLADISACTIREPNDYGYVEADIAATNSGTTDVDYTVEVALVDAANVRRGYGTAYIDRTAAGATAPGEVYTTVAYDPTYRCDVIAVTRFDSAQ